MTWTLSGIREKVRNLIGRKSTNQVSNSDLNDYINRFYTNDLLMDFDYKEIEEEWKFHTVENVDFYAIPNNIINLDGEGYINGDPFIIHTDFNAFYDRYPKFFQTRENIGSGDGATTTFSGSLSKTPVHRENIVIDDDTESFTVDINQALRPISGDIFISGISQASPAVVTTAEPHGLSNGDKVQIINVDGMDEINGVITTITVLSTTTFSLAGVDATDNSAYLGNGEAVLVLEVNLVGDRGGSGGYNVSTGTYSITFSTAPASGQDIRANYEFYSPGIPVSGLHYKNKLFLTPFPDGDYFVEIPAKKSPTDLFGENDVPIVESWGKIIAYGAAIDFLNDEGQQDTSSLLEPQFRRLKSHAISRDLRNMQNERSIPRF